jgi:lipopolysaccharide export LptBFGC system permease protein LptF
MKWFKVLQEGSLPFFNGISMVLAVYFSGSFPQVVTGGAAPIWAAFWAVLMGVFGVLLALFNIWFTFPREVK